jgi:hypothetical protein
MSENMIKVNMTNVESITKTIAKCLIEMRKLGVQWTLAEYIIAAYKIANGLENDTLEAEQIADKTVPKKGMAA